MDPPQPTMNNMTAIPPPARKGRRGRASAMLWAVLDGTALAPGAAFFPALVNHLAAALGVQYVFRGRMH